MKRSFIILVSIYLLIVGSRFFPYSKLNLQTQATTIAGGIVPHHLFVKDIINNFFNNITREDIANVIIIGPNHLELGESNVTYNPEFTDQTISAVEPYVKEFFPSSKITRILLKKNLSLHECDILSSKILSLEGKSILVASIDFSHYLTSLESERNDKVTLSMLKNKDYQGILNLNSDYLDSPASLVTSLMYFEKRNSSNIKILSNTNSGRRGNPYSPTTSYFSIIFYEQK